MMALKKAFQRLAVWWVLTGWSALYVSIAAQTPVITVRFANAQNDCVTQEYCLDVEFKSDTPDQEVFGMNVRFFYDDQILELIDFRDFQGGYGAVAPDPPIIFTSEPAGPALFNFEGPAEFINGAIQLVNTGAEPIILDTENWSKIFQICFDVDGPIANLDTFCPAVVWDLEQDPTNGGFLAGDDGVVITMVDPDPNNESYAADENVVQFNWEYIGDGTAPYGQPVDLECSNINCALPVALLSFKGSSTENGHLLEWQTTNEIHASGFEVQKSYNRTSWTIIGFEAANNQAMEISKYGFVDYHPASGNNYYRLRQLDSDGRSTFSSIINIPGFSTSSEYPLILYPNPIQSGHLFVNTPAVQDAEVDIQLINPQGQIIRQTRMEPSGSYIDISGLPAGVYLVRVNFLSQHLTRKVTIFP